MKWRTQDWLWLTGFLLLIIIISFSLWLGNYTINFSIISSSVSIALAVIAIFMAMEQNKDNKYTIQEIKDMKYEIITGVKDVSTKVEKMPLNITDLIQKADKKKSFSQTEEDSNNNGENTSETNNSVKYKAIYSKILNINEKNNLMSKYQLNIQFNNNHEIDVISKIISDNLNGKNILYNKVDIANYEFVFVSNNPNLHEGENVFYITELITDNIQGALLTGMFKIG